VCLSAGTRDALAGSFAPDGTFQFDPQAVFTLSFEPGEEGTGGMGGAGGSGGSGGSGSMAGTGGAGGMGASGEPALDGVQSLALTPFVGVDLPVTILPEARTYRATAWIRDAESTLDLEVSYGAVVDEVAALYPTGRMTSDGWIEVSNEHIRIDGTRSPTVTLGAFSSASARVDAFELVPDGVMQLADYNHPCGGATDASSCGPEQVCVFSQCRNVGGWVPPIPADRDQVAQYLENRIRFLFGPYLERSLDLPNALAAIDGMKHATNKWDYWNGFLLAVRRLHDGHTSTSGLGDFVLRNKKPIAVCFLEGDADLSHAAAPSDPDYHDVLVSHVGGDHTLGLHAGDRLVAVDGQHPIAWARGLVQFHWGIEPTSNHRTFAELAETLRGLISRYAREITVIRCDQASNTCGAPETISIEGLPELAAGEMVNSTSCDNRPLRHLPTSPAGHDMGETVYSGIVDESNATERIYGLEWESLYTTDGTDGVGPALSQAVATWKADAQGVILDHRSGNGGTILAPMILWNFAVPQHASDAYLDRPLAEAEMPTLAEGLSMFQEAAAVGLVENAGSTSPSQMPVALLTTRDVSASDWLPWGMKGAPHVRIFAPYETNGGFSTRYSLGYWLSMGYVLAVGDTLAPDGHTLNGTGVSPDVVVLPKESDLLQGRDTVYEAALAWVRSELP
jgi:hypothetical protein